MAPDGETGAIGRKEGVELFQEAIDLLWARSLVQGMKIGSLVMACAVLCCILKARLSSFLFTLVARCLVSGSRLNSLTQYTQLSIHRVAVTMGKALQIWMYIPLQAVDEPELAAIRSGLEQPWARESKRKSSSVSLYTALQIPQMQPPS